MKKEQGHPRSGPYAFCSVQFFGRIPPALDLLELAIGAFLAECLRPFLEHFPTGMNRGGFPKRRESGSSCVLAKEVRMHGQGAFR